MNLKRLDKRIQSLESRRSNGCPRCESRQESEPHLNLLDEEEVEYWRELAERVNTSQTCECGARYEGKDLSRLTDTELNALIIILEKLDGRGTESLDSLTEAEKAEYRDLSELDLRDLSAAQMARLSNLKHKAKERR